MSDANVRSTDENETGALLAAAVLGAALGAGLGLLVGRALDTDVGSLVMRSARKRVRTGAKRVRRVASSAGSAAGGAFDDTREAVGDFASHARERLEDALEREVKQLRKLARRQRRRLGF